MQKFSLKDKSFVKINIKVGLFMTNDLKEARTRHKEFFLVLVCTKKYDF